MRTRTRDCSMRVDDSIPFSYLLGNNYSGYHQAMNFTGDLTTATSTLQKLFGGLPKEKRRQLAMRMLEADHSMAELERNIRLAAEREVGSLKQKARVPEGIQLWDRTDDNKGGLNQVGQDGRSVVQERYRPRTPFLVVESGELYAYERSDRMEKPRAREQCEAGRQRRSKQENMQNRVRAQERYLEELEKSKRDWRHFQTRLVKNRALASVLKKLRVRLNYGTGQREGIGSEETTTPIDRGFDDIRREKRDLVRAWKEARASQCQRNIKRVQVRRREKEIIQAIRESSNSIELSPSVACDGSYHFRRRESVSLGGLLLPGAQSAGGVKRRLVSSVKEKATEFQEEQCEGEEAEESNMGGSNQVDEAEVRAIEEHATGEAEDSSYHYASLGPGSGKSSMMWSDRSGEVDFKGKEEATGRIPGHLPRTSSSTASAMIRPLSIKPPTILEVQEDSHRDVLVARIRSQSGRHSISTRCESGRTFKGGGWRTRNSPSSLSPIDDNDAAVLGKQLFCPARSGRGSAPLNLEAMSEARDAKNSQKQGRKSICHQNNSRRKLFSPRNHFVSPITMLHDKEVKRLSRPWSSSTNTSSSRPGGPGQSYDIVVDATTVACLHRGGVGGSVRHHSSVPVYLLERLYGAGRSTTRPRPILTHESHSEDS